MLAIELFLRVRFAFFINLFSSLKLDNVHPAMLTAVVDLIVTASYNNDDTTESSVSDDLSHRR